jgi:hypothetical protein
MIKDSLTWREDEHGIVIDVYVDWIDKFVHPKKWRRSLRRTFVLTLPISGILWAISAFLITVVILLIGLFFLVLDRFCQMWKIDSSS